MLCLLALGASSAFASVPRGFIGINVDGPLFPSTAPGVNLAAQMDAMVAAGVQNVRVVFDWSYAQPYKSFADVPPEQSPNFVNANGVPTNFGLMDKIVTLAAQRRLTVLPTVLYTPAWDAAPHPKNTFAIPKSDAPYAKFLTSLIERYGPHGDLWRSVSPVTPIRSWQIWNEPSFNYYWPQRHFTSGYAALVHASHDAIKRADHGARVVLAGLPNFSWVQVNNLYKVNGFSKWFDVVALHPFTKTPQGVIAIIAKVRAVMNAHGDRRKPIIASEVSWTSSAGKTSHNVGFTFATTEAGQAKRIGQALPLLARDRGKLNLAGFDYYDWAGIEDVGGDPFNWAGLLRFNSNGTFSPKPALASFRRAALKLEGCRSKGPTATACHH